MHALFSTGLAIHRAPRVQLPISVVLLMQNILPSLSDPSLEYGVYLKGAWNPETATVVVSDEYHIPEQEVTASTIRFVEEPPGPEWNVVIHRHPPGCRKFSGVDKSSINEEFLASILFLPPWEFPDAVVNVPLAAGSKLQVEAAVSIASGDLPREVWEQVRGKIFERQIPVGPPAGLVRPSRPSAPVQMGRGFVRDISHGMRDSRDLADMGFIRKSSSSGGDSDYLEDFAH